MIDHNYMKFKTLLSFAAAGIMAMACGKEPAPQPAPEKMPIKLSASLYQFTKATDTSFENGDEISVNIFNPECYLYNAKYTYTDGSLTSASAHQWYEDTEVEATITAVYPASDTMEGFAENQSFMIQADQSSKEGYGMSDLMLAVAKSKPTAEAVKLPFQHALSKVVINVDNQLKEDIENVWFTDVMGEVSYKTADPVATLAATGSAGTVKAYKSAENTWQLIISPQTASPKLAITTTSGKQFTFILSENVTFNPGKVSTATVIVSPDTIYTSFTPEISDWVADNELNFSQRDDEYIKDYYALYEIWESLHGEEWKYVGKDYPTGTNWDFNKNVDLWGDQPGVSLHPNGRVAVINLSGFGFYGDMSPSIGQLTELVELYLGTHNDNHPLDHDPTVVPGQGTANRIERHKEYLSALHPTTQMTEPIARALAEHGIVIPETAMYATMQEKDIIDKSTGKMLFLQMDLNHGKLCNGLTSLPAEIGKLTKLEQIFIANGELTELPAEMEKLEACTDFEIYNCPKMTKFPMVLAKMPSLITLNIANNSQWNAEEALKGLKALATGAAAEKIQLLYFNQNNLEVLPKELKNMKKLGLIDFASNKIHTIEEAWGTDIKPIQLYLDNNQLSSFPVDENEVFCFMDDAEIFSVRNNKFTEFPDIFDANSLYTINSIDFSNNEISGFQNSENFKGVKVNTLTLANNPPMTKYPIEIAKSNSTVKYVNVRGCNIYEIPNGSFEYENSIYLTSLDLSYNDLDDLPWDMHAGNLPYLYGVELSYNCFNMFPWEPFDMQYLTVFAIRGQRDKNGKRCLTEWPTGLYQHRGLRGFYISSNNLGKIEDKISTSCYYLDISDNPEIIFDATDICYAIQAGTYILIYDQMQDIRSCPELFY